MEENSPIFIQIQQDYEECLTILGELKGERTNENQSYN